jgi:Tfp pilus assembly protein PilO
MTGRDRMVVIGLIVVAVLGATWVLAVSPERKQATKLSAQVASAQSQLSSAESELASARTAEASYPAAYASIVSLGKAVPATEEVPSLIYQLAQATEQKNVEFASISAGAGSAGSSSASAGASATAAPAATFTAMPFTFVFNGSFFDLEHLFHRLDGFARRTAAGGVSASGRLLTIQSVKLTPTSTATSNSGGLLSGTITASAYELPASQGLTGSATATSPTGAATPAASTTSAASSAPAPATVKVIR